MMKKSRLLFLSFFLLICSCQKGESPAIYIDQIEFSISDVGGSQDIYFASTVNWSAKSSEIWCTTSLSSGEASVRGIIATISPNESYEARSCIITITAGSVSRTLTINQSAQLGILVSPNRYDLSNDAFTIEMEIKANVQFDFTISDDWISINSTKGLYYSKALASSKLYFDIAKNGSNDNRDGTITFKQKDGPLTSIVKINQSR